MLLTRLERVSVDSYWAHRASEIRGALLQRFDPPDQNQQSTSPQVVKLIVDGFQIFESAAKRSREA